MRCTQPTALRILAVAQRAPHAYPLQDDIPPNRHRIVDVNTSAAHTPHEAIRDLRSLCSSRTTLRPHVGDPRAKGSVGGATRGALFYRRFSEIVHEMLFKAGGERFHI